MQKKVIMTLLVNNFSDEFFENFENLEESLVAPGRYFCGFEIYFLRKY